MPRGARGSNSITVERLNCFRVDQQPVPATNLKMSVIFIMKNILISGFGLISKTELKQDDKAGCGKSAKSIKLFYNYH